MMCFKKVTKNRPAERDTETGTNQGPDSSVWNEDEPLSIFMDLGMSLEPEEEEDTPNAKQKSNQRRRRYRRRSTVRTIQERPILLSALIVLLGFGVSAAFLALGVKGAKRQTRMRLEKRGSDISKAIESTWNYYKMAAMWIHDSCRSTADHNVLKGDFPICSRTDFRSLYENLIANGLEFKSIAYVPNVTHAYRAQMEMEAREYYHTHYPSVNYTGFTDIARDPVTQQSFFRPAAKKDFYFPQHLVEPVIGNEDTLGFDIQLSQAKIWIEGAVTNWKPFVSKPIFTPLGKYVFMLHPGIKVSTSNVTVSPGISSTTILFNSIIKFATRGQSSGLTVYVYDIGNSIQNTTFFGGAKLKSPPPNESSENVALEFLPETNLTTLRKQLKHVMVSENHIHIEQRTWTVIVTAESQSFDGDLAYVILGGALILATCCCLALWFHARVSRMMHIEEIKSAVEAEKAALVLENIKKVVQRERDLNEYLAHEVRNPLAAALSACSFLGFAHQDPNPILPGDERHKTIQEDIRTIQNSLTYINDLLRSMLDIHKTRDKQVTLVNTPTDILKDILEPVRTILSRHTSGFDILLNCPDHLMVMVDRIRLKQVILNLASNARKFVEKGYIRINAEVASGDHLRMSVEDSGPGIPEGKRNKLFARFQESLDSLNQGTGIGLSLCRSLVKLMGGRIYLDESYRSDVEGCPGARFVVFIKAPRVDIESMDLDQYKDKAKILPIQHDEEKLPVKKDVSCEGPLQASTESEHPKQLEMSLPQELSVLVVDDDMVLRKLLSRSLKRVAPAWKIEEAANGETALEMASSTTYDLIFMDQYMASVEKQLLGTETVEALRAKGVQSRICGLSANNLGDAFRKAGADYFILKPFRCEKKALEEDLLHVLYD